jgi:NAD(P)-dependent dehydrogenase (short-subunit alcohol dehydrogenase family)
MTQERQQKPPGTVQAMLRKPDHGEDSHRGCAKLTDKGRPAEVAPVYVLLASDEASYISGARIDVIGGRPVL